MLYRRFPFGVGLVALAILLPASWAQTSPARETGGIDPTRGIISAELLRYHVSAKVLRKLQEARDAAEAGDHAAAIDRLQKILASYPDSAAWSQSMLGVEYLKTGQFAAAVSALEPAVVLLPRNAVDRSNLGLALFAAGQYDRAEQELRRAVELDRRDRKAEELLHIVLAAGSRGRGMRNPE